MLFATCFCISPEILKPTLVIFILARYSEIPFAENTTIIRIGINQARVLSWSIKIFLTAGSNSHAVADVVPATTSDKKRQKNSI